MASYAEIAKDDGKENENTNTNINTKSNSSNEKVKQGDLPVTQS
jgi:hypothetical protein